MTDRTGEDEKTSDEAALWAARLNHRVVDAEVLEAFYRWRRDPANATAFARIERTWQAAGDLGSDRDIALAVQDALDRPRAAHRLDDALRAVRRRPLLAAGTVLLMLGLATLIVLRLPTSFDTVVGEQRVVRLADGSRIRLNTDSRVRVRLGEKLRQVELVRGEAFFEVAHDPARPFVVRAATAEVRATGTRFDVDLARSAVRVVLAQGSVHIRDPRGDVGSGANLVPGQVSWIRDGSITEPRAIDVAAATSWTTGHLTFHETPLRDAVAEVNRYTDKSIDLSAGAAIDARVNGVFETGDTTAFVAAVTTLFPLRAEVTTDGRVRLVTSG